MLITKQKNAKKNIALLKRLVSEADFASLDEYNTSESISKRPEIKREAELKKKNEREKMQRLDKEKRAQLLMDNIIKTVNELSNRKPMQFLSEIINLVKNSEQILNE